MVYSYGARRASQGSMNQQGPGHVGDGLDGPFCHSMLFVVPVVCLLLDLFGSALKILLSRFCPQGSATK
eukprot:11990911-Ditylum_brightwellii.AAC.1